MSDNWQPIETAPRDATSILVMNNDCPGCEGGVADAEVVAAAGRVQVPAIPWSALCPDREGKRHGQPGKKQTGTKTAQKMSPGTPVRIIHKHASEKVVMDISQDYHCIPESKKTTHKKSRYRGSGKI